MAGFLSLQPTARATAKTLNVITPSVLMRGPFTMGQESIGDFIVTEVIAQSAHHLEMGVGEKVPDIAFVATALAFTDDAEFFEAAEMAHHGTDGTETGGENFGQIHRQAEGLPVADKNQQFKIEAVAQERKTVAVIVADGFQQGENLEQFIILDIASHSKIGRSKGCHADATVE
jgi:hypothetical protein